MEGAIKDLLTELKAMFSSESSGHDIYHLIRTYNLAMTLQKHEGGDRLVIGVSAISHDVHRIIQKEGGEYCSPKESLPKVRELYEKTGLEEPVIEKALHVVEFHEEYSFSKQGKTVDDIETLIVQDADNLDAIGAVGVARACMFAGSYGLPLWLPDVPISGDQYEESNLDVSEIHHFYHKLLKLKDNMNTESGKSMAQLRHNYMEDFLKQFFGEWEGKI